MGKVGDRVLEARTEKKWSQERLAKEVGLRSKRTIGALETGEHQGSGKLHRIAEALGVNVKWLETGQGAKHLNPSGVNDESVKTGKNSADNPWSASHIDESLAPILAQAESWVRFEEKAAQLAGGDPWGPADGLQSVRRARRLIAFTRLLQEHGGQLDPREAAEIIDAARTSGEPTNDEHATPAGRGK